MENKILVAYGTDEADLLLRIEQAGLSPSKSETLRRGLKATGLLIDSDETILLRLLLDTLQRARANIAQHEQLVSYLSDALTLSNSIQAVWTAKKGSAAAEFLDMFTATLRELSLLADAKAYQEADKEQLEETLVGLIGLARTMGPPGHGLAFSVRSRGGISSGSKNGSRKRTLGS